MGFGSLGPGSFGGLARVVGLGCGDWFGCDELAVLEIAGGEHDDIAFFDSGEDFDTTPSGAAGDHATFGGFTVLDEEDLFESGEAGDGLSREHEGALLGADDHFGAGEGPWSEAAVVGEVGLDGESAGLLADDGAKTFDMAGEVVGIAINGEADGLVDLDFLGVAFGDLDTKSQRIHAYDGGDGGGDAKDFTDLRSTFDHTAIEGGEDLGIGQFLFGDLDLGAALGEDGLLLADFFDGELELGFGDSEVGFCGFEFGVWEDPLVAEFEGAFAGFDGFVEHGAGLFDGAGLVEDDGIVGAIERKAERGAGLGEEGLGLEEAQFVIPSFEASDQISFFDFGTEVDSEQFETAGDFGAESGLVDRGESAGGLDGTIEKFVGRFGGADGAWSGGAVSACGGGFFGGFTARSDPAEREE